MSNGPVLNDAISEVQGIFPTDAALQEAVAKLTLAGFDRAALSLPHASPHTAEATPEQGTAPLGTETDTRQMRTLLSSTAGASGALIAAGVTVATGGAAGVVIAAAAAGGLLAGGATSAASSAVGDAQKDGRDKSAADGTLVLAVHAPTPEAAAKAEAALHAAGATSVARVVREGADIV
jgi:hypothetical protein